mmetsp:Transcript_2323/g.2708  ORF Transcript_2323/g.2708 Transcript_2323/m.2708 type:complete len:430 (-) Transcript_2323:144-1433(-)
MVDPTEKEETTAIPAGGIPPTGDSAIVSPHKKKAVVEEQVEEEQVESEKEGEGKKDSQENNSDVAPTSIADAINAGEGLTATDDEDKVPLAVPVCSINELWQKVMIDLEKHRLANEYFSIRQYRYFTIPQAVLTLFSSFLAFFSSSIASSNFEVKLTSKLDLDLVTILTLIVGSISSIVVFLQTVSGECIYGKRATMHDAMSINLRNLGNELSLSVPNNNPTQSITNQHTHWPARNNVNNNQTEVDKVKNIKSYVDRYKEYQNVCKSEFPLEINTLFNKFETDFETEIGKAKSEIQLAVIEIFAEKNNSNYGKKYSFMNTASLDLVEKFKPLFAKALRNLVKSCTTSLLFPIFLPDPEQVTAYAMESIKGDLRDISVVYQSTVVAELELRKNKPETNELIRTKKVKIAYAALEKRQEATERTPMLSRCW